MLRHFFSAPNLLGLLRFWDRGRVNGGVPDWNGELARIPAALLPRLVIVQRRETLIYRYVGTENVKLFGRDPTGRSIAETLSPDYAAYISDVIGTTLTTGHPVFSASVLHLDDKVKLTGRLVVPFTDRGAAEPSLIMSAHLVGGDEFKVTEITEPGSIVEIQRLMIADVPEVCSRLEEAGRYYRLSRLATDRGLAEEWDRIAGSFGADALVPMEGFRDARG